MAPAEAPGPKERIRAVPIFDKLNSMQLHRLSQTVSTRTFADEEAIVARAVTEYLETEG